MTSLNRFQREKLLPLPTTREENRTVSSLPPTAYSQEQEQQQHIHYVLWSSLLHTWRSIVGGILSRHAAAFYIVDPTGVEGDPGRASAATNLPLCLSSLQGNVVFESPSLDCRGRHPP